MLQLKGNATRFGQRLQTSGDVDRIAEDVVVIYDHIAEMDSEAVRNALLFRRRAHREAALKRNRPAHGVEPAREFNQKAVSGRLDDAAAMGCQRRIDLVAAQGTQPIQGAFLVFGNEPTIACYVGYQDCREAARSGAAGFERLPP